MANSGMERDNITTMEANRSLVIGLDGATWQLLDRLIEDGKMPVLAELVRQGIHGPLASTLPYLSPVAWTSLATGLYPGKHRVFGFFDPQYTYVRAPRLNQPSRPVSAIGIGAPSLYKVLNRLGKTAGLILVPVTHPPAPIDGYIVGDGILTPAEGSDYSWPPHLKGILLRSVPGFRIRPYEYLRYELPFIEEVIQHIEQQGQAVRWLMAHYPTDFTMAVFTGTDVIQHGFWKYMDPASPLYETKKGAQARSKLWPFYERLDQVIGQIVASAPSDMTVLLVSDHGFTLSRRIFAVNRWLYEQGLLVLRDRGAGRFKQRLVRSGLTQERVFGFLKKLDVLNLRQKLRGQGRLAAGVTARQSIQRLIAPEVDWSRTRAYAGNLGEPYIYINLKGRDPSGTVEPGEEYEQLVNLLCAKLSALCDPKSGKPIARRVYRASELYPGPYVHEAPDIILDLCEPSLVTSDTVQVDRVFQDEATCRGTHDPYGIFLLVGTGVRKGAQIQNARIVDVMPTVFYLLGVPVPAGLDGRVLTEAFTDEFLASHPIQYGIAATENEIYPDRGGDIYTDEESTEIADRLRDLGYIS